MSFSDDISALVLNSADDIHAASASWARTPLGKIATIQNGYPFESDFFTDDGGARLIRIRDVTTGDTSTFYRGLVPAGYWVQKGDIVVGMDGDFNQRVWQTDPGLLNQRVCKIVPDTSLLDPNFLVLVLPGYLRLINEHTHSVTVKHLSSRTLQQIPLPLPPLVEQRRIVARIEALFARTRRARADLERIAPLSAAYRQRSLEQIFADATDRSELVPLGSLLAAIEAGKNMRCDERRPGPGERGIIKISAVTWGRFDPAAIKTAPDDAALDPRNRIADGDFLLSRANTLELVGAPVIATDVPADTFLSDKVLRLRFRRPVDRWVLWFLRSPAGRREIEARSSGNQLSMRNIGQGELRQIPVPLPDAASRTQAIDAIERGEERTAIAERESTRALALLDRLEQSILACAFRGELVPQDPAAAAADDAERSAPRRRVRVPA